MRNQRYAADCLPLVDTMLATRDHERAEERFSENERLAYYVANKFRRSEWIMGVLSEDEVEALCLETLWDACRGFDPDRGVCFSSYAVRAMKNNVLREVRRHWQDRCRVCSLDAAENQDRNDWLAVEDAEPDETHEQVERLLRLVPAKDRPLLRLHYQRGLTIQEIAVKRGLSKETVRVRLNRGLAAIKQRIRSA